MVSRRFSVAAGFYRTCVIDGILEHSPAEHVRRPSVPELRPEPVAVAGRRRIAGGGRDRLRGLGDARGRPGGHGGPGLANEQDRAAVVQAAPTGLERHCPVSRCQAAPDDAAVRALVPNSGRCLLACLCAGLDVVSGGSNRPFGLVIPCGERAERRFPASCAAWLLASFWRSTRRAICDILGMSAGECAGHALTG
jgi:hypothetical protein